MPMLSFASTTLLIGDTGFCLGKMPKYSSKIHLKELNPKTRSEKDFCQKIAATRPYHGHYGLKILLHNLRAQDQIDIDLIELYDADGVALKKNWKLLIDQLMSGKYQLLSLAAGAPGELARELQAYYLTRPHPQVLPGIVLASGSVGLGIEQSSVIWPQSFDLPAIKVATFIPAAQNATSKKMKMALAKPLYGHFDTGLYHPEEIDFFIQRPGPKVFPSGSSYALWRSLPYILNQCRQLDHNKLLKCLKQEARPMRIKSKERLFLPIKFTESK